MSTYGAMPSTALLQQRQSAELVGSPAKQALGVRNRSDYVVATACLLVPWVVFIVNASLLSFTAHYRHVQLCWLAVELTFCTVVLEGYFAVRAWRRSHTRDPTWFVFLFAATALGWILGTALGMVTYSSHMRPYYDIASLEMYVDIDPATASGLRYLDAGRIVFTKESHIEPSLSAGVKHDLLYCAAPVTTGSGVVASYDYWVVGTNCCSPAGEYFSCAGEATNPRAHSAMRLLDESSVEFYRQAVAHAEFEHGIKASHPMFFTWVEDPVTSVNSHQEAGFNNFLMGTFTFFAFQLFCIAVLSTGSVGLGRGSK